MTSRKRTIISWYRTILNRLKPLRSYSFIKRFYWKNTLYGTRVLAFCLNKVRGTSDEVRSREFVPRTSYLFLTGVLFRYCFYKKVEPTSINLPSSYGFSLTLL